MIQDYGKRITGILCVLLPTPLLAKSGSVNYSWGADALATMHDYVVTMMLYVSNILNKSRCLRRKSKILDSIINCISM